MEGTKFMKNRFYMSLVAFLLLCLLGWAQYAKAQRSGSMKQTWEYQVMVFKDISAVNSIPGMNKLGADGWELTSVFQDSGGYFLAYFKRPK
jgi:hypothetical protein